jgi:hypothetical protein
LTVHTKAMLSVSLLVVAWGIPQLLAGQPPAIVEIGKFSAAMESDPLPPGWEPLTFEKIPRHTTYSLVRDGDRLCVKAVSKAASSGLTREMRLDPREYPIVQWEWKVTNVLQKGDVSKKAGDDYPARLYITFEYDPARVGFFKKAQYETIRFIYGRYPPLGAINYIWESGAPVGTMVPNSYTDQVMMFVVQSGVDKLNTWVTERRNVYEDYKKAFGMEPPTISGVAIMTDSDNTGESATAYYGDIAFLPAGG